jgi:phage baseplate assembly protein W
VSFGAKKIFPIDTKPGTGVGISIPFNSPGVFKSTYLTKDAIKVNLLNFFLTNQNEIYLNPLFGGNLRAFIFEQITNNNLDGLKEDIQTQLGLFFPNIIISSLDILSNPDNNEIIIDFKYSILNTGITDELTISFT